MIKCIYLILTIIFAIKSSLEEPKNEKELIIKEYVFKNNSIELEQDFFITQISWTKKEDYKLNYLLGIFEGSNDKSFMDGIPIAIIKDQKKFNKMNYIDINAVMHFKHIRYVPPNKNNTDISPIKIYGYQLFKSNKESQVNSSERYYQTTNLPLLVIHTANSTEPNEKNDTNCSITLINEGKIEIKDNAGIKVRGRSTRKYSPKKPYRIKFFNKQKILNFTGYEKKWTLIANYYDGSLLRNSLAYKISELMQFKFTPRCTPIDVIVNGIFSGNYYICDKIEVGENRINITKMEKTDNDEPNISGGYLLKIDALSEVGSNPNNFRTKKGVKGTILYPEEGEATKEQLIYIKNQLNKLEQEIYDGNLDSVDLDTYSKFFLVEEFCGDIDHVWSSFYFTKERNDEKFYFGPVWDFDIAFDNDERLILTNNKPNFCLFYGDSAGTARQLIQKLIENQKVMEHIKKTWEKLCDTVLNENVLIDYLEEEKMKLKESSELNDLKWNNYLLEEEEHKKKRSFGIKKEYFEESVKVVINYVKNRFESLTKLINEALSSKPKSPYPNYEKKSDRGYSYIYNI